MMFKDKVHLGFLEPYAYRSSYKDAGDIIIEKFFDDNSRNEFLIIPAFYLYRHFVELTLKDIFFASNELLDFISKDLQEKSDLFGHNLIKIANAVDENIKKLSKELDEDIEFFSLPEDLCYFHPLITMLDSFDKNGESFRYYKKKNGETSLDSTTIINPITLKDMVKRFEDESSGLIDYLENSLSDCRG